MTATDAPQDGAGFDYDNITSLSSDSCARPGGRSNYTPPSSKKAPDEAGFDGYDDEAEGCENPAPKKFVDTGFDGFDDDGKGPATISLIGGAAGAGEAGADGDDGGDGDDRPAA